MAEPIEIPFGLWTLVNPRNYLLDRDGVQIPHERGTFEGSDVRIFPQATENVCVHRATLT